MFICTEGPSKVVVKPDPRFSVIQPVAGVQINILRTCCCVDTFEHDIWPGYTWPMPLQRSCVRHANDNKLPNCCDVIELIPMTFVVIVVVYCASIISKWRFSLLQDVAYDDDVTALRHGQWRHWPSLYTLDHRTADSCSPRVAPPHSRFTVTRLNVERKSWTKTFSNLLAKYSQDLYQFICRRQTTE